jgi:hypothetical protein
MMFTMAWNPTEFQVIDIPPSGGISNSNDSQNAFFVWFSEWPTRRAVATNGRLIIHADDARPQRAAEPALQKLIEDNGTVRTPHLPYFPSVTLFDPYLLGHVGHNSDPIRAWL